MTTNPNHTSRELLTNCNLDLAERIVRDAWDLGPVYICMIYDQTYWTRGRKHTELAEETIRISEDTLDGYPDAHAREIREIVHDGLITTPELKLRSVILTGPGQGPDHIYHVCQTGHSNPQDCMNAELFVLFPGIGRRD